MNNMNKNSADSPTRLIYWRVSIRHYDFTKALTCVVSYGYHPRQSEDTVIKNKERGWSGWTEIKYFKDKEAAKRCASEVEKFAS